MTSKKMTDQSKNLSKLEVVCIEGKEHESSAKAMSSPEARAALTIQKFDDFLDVNALASEMRAQTAAIQSGDMARAEAMLAAQAHTLDALFCTMARRAHSNMVEGYTDAAERYFKLGLKAQGQCIRTIEAMSELKNPKQIAYVGQANFSGGHQQVNNHPSQAGKNQIEQTKLSAEDSNELLPDTRAQSETSRANPALEAMGTLHRA